MSWSASKIIVTEIFGDIYFISHIHRHSVLYKISSGGAQSDVTLTDISFGGVGGHRNLWDVLSADHRYGMFGLQKNECKKLSVSAPINLITHHLPHPAVCSMLPSLTLRESDLDVVLMIGCWTIATKYNVTTT